MQIITNERFASSRAKIGKWGTISGLAGMGAGLVASFNFEYISVAYACLIFGLLAFNVGRYNAIRWGGRPRVDEILANALKGLDQKYLLINYASGMPSSHMILSPFGLVHVETRHNDGEIVCDGDRWRRKGSVFFWLRGLAEGQLGNPTRSALAAADRLKSFLAERLGADVAQQIPVEGIVVFMSPRVDLKVSGASVPSILPKDLKASVRTPQGRNKMPPEVYRKLQEFLASENGKNGKAEKQNQKVRTPAH